MSFVSHNNDKSSASTRKKYGWDFHFRGHHTAGAVASVLVMRKMKIIVSAGWDKVVHVWLYDDNLRKGEDIEPVGSVRIEQWANHVSKYDDETFFLGSWGKKCRICRVLDKSPYVDVVSEISTPNVVYSCLKLSDEHFLAVSSDKYQVYGVKTGTLHSDFEWTGNIGYYSYPILSKKWENVFYLICTEGIVQQNYLESKPMNVFNKRGVAGMSICSYMNKEGDEIIVFGSGVEIHFINASIKDKSEELIKTMGISIGYGGHNIWVVKSLPTKFGQYIFAGDTKGYISVIDIRDGRFETVLWRNVDSKDYVRDLDFLEISEGRVKFVVGTGDYKIRGIELSGVRVKIEDEQETKDLRERVDMLCNDIDRVYFGKVNSFTLRFGLGGEILLYSKFLLALD